MEGVSENRIQDGVPTDVTMNGDDLLIEEELNTETGQLGDRPVRKARRQLSRQTSGGDGTSNSNAQTTKKVVLFNKNSRKSRDGRGRGMPKKGLLYFSSLQLCVYLLVSHPHVLQLLCNAFESKEVFSINCVVFSPVRCISTYLFTFQPTCYVCCSQRRPPYCLFFLERLFHLIIFLVNVHFFVLLHRGYNYW